MTMSRKDYRDAAEIIKRVETNVETSSEHAVAREIAHELAGMFARDNGRFDRQKFLTACGIGD